MRAENKEARMQQIEAAAYALLEEVGYDGTSMLAVAKRARASNETMYRWYGDKNGLFARMVQVNAGRVTDALKAQVAADAPPLEALRSLAPVLLEMLLSDGAIALNRAAAADPTGGLGRTIHEGGRATVLPLIRALMERAERDGDLSAPASGTMGSLFMHLLVGDQQIRRVIGALAAPTREEAVSHARTAMAQFEALCRPAPTASLK